MITALSNRIAQWWRRPPPRERILAVLRESNEIGGVTGMVIGDRANVAPRHLYTALRKLEAEGVIVHTEGVHAVNRGRRPRFYYRLVER